ncbi:gliding motility protein GldC [Solirubrum puertoriconensis]|uniref:Gliding motility protein GldC n=1 Tax=Solirubrum puertoriconensis TaxID=1751427 RepID=A0A9X0L495_SOLP1|nr:gliding motility protein GldC [Solirubrum puertoriconensis]KUG07360.1 gliding motility protein GldC [Solirubrum puertoriconensis]
MKKSEIRFSIALDDQNIPEAISWSATDAGADINFAKAMNISIWDREQLGTMKIDLWTKEMPVNEMKRFYVDMIGSLAESIVAATNDEYMGAKLRALGKEMAQHVEQEERNQK